MANTDLNSQTHEFLGWLQEWTSKLPRAEIADASRTAVIVVDMVNGFCKTGNLASERIGNLIPNVVRMLEEAYSAGTSRFLIAEDTHREDDREFIAFPPHCISGTGEETTVDEIRSLPFANNFTYISKPTVNVCVATDICDRIGRMLDEGIDTFVIVGDCTDLCVYQAASQIRMQTNAANQPARALIPADAVDTYDLPVSTAKGAGALPHPGELTHRLFLYHMALIGCEVVSSVIWSRTR